MSSNRRVLSSRANGALSRGPKTPLGKQRSSQNAITHGLLAECVLLSTERPENFQDLVAQHLDRFQPGDGLEQVMIEEMAAACWRMRRAWAIETRIFENQIATESSMPDDMDKMARCFAGPEGGPPALGLLHRYEARLHLMYRRAMNNILLLRNIDLRTEPNPISEHQAEHQAALPAPETPEIAPPEPVENA